MKSTQFSRLSFVIFLVAAQSSSAVSPQALWEAAKVKAAQAQQATMAQKITAATVTGGAGALLVGGLLWRRTKLNKENVQPEISSQVPTQSQPAAAQETIIPVLSNDCLHGQKDLYTQWKETLNKKFEPLRHDLARIKLPNRNKLVPGTKPYKMLAALSGIRLGENHTKEELKKAHEALVAKNLPGELPRTIAKLFGTDKDRENMLAYNKGKNAVNLLARK